MKKLDSTKQNEEKNLSEKKTERNSNSDDVKLFARKQIESIMGKGKVISEVFQRVEEYAELDCPLLIEGETGVGKKEIAIYLHRDFSFKKIKR